MDNRWGCFSSVRSLALSIQNLCSSRTQNQADTQPPTINVRRATTRTPPSTQTIRMADSLGFDIPGHVRRYSTAVMRDAVRSGRIIGDGATANVYQGVLEGREVAIKQMNRNRGSDFEKELKILCSLDNANIVKVLGYSFGGDDERFIVYPFMEKGSLDICLFAGGDVLTWKQRLDVALGIAHGVEYLHNGIEGDRAIIHNDLKPDNILLDKDLIAHVSDFNVAEEIEKDAITKDVTTLGGTVGYIDYHNINSGDIARGTDIFAFGGILYDMIRGEKIVEKKPLEELTDEMIEGIMDRNLLGVSIESFRDLILLFNECRRSTRDERPPIEEVITRLEGIKSRA